MSVDMTPKVYLWISGGIDHISRGVVQYLGNVGRGDIGGALAEAYVSFSQLKFGPASRGTHLRESGNVQNCAGSRAEGLRAH